MSPRIWYKSLWDNDSISQQIEQEIDELYSVENSHISKVYHSNITSNEVSIYKRFLLMSLQTLTYDEP